MTRAQTRLILTGAVRRRVFGEYKASDPSRFLEEIPSTLIAVVEPMFSTPAPGPRTFGQPRRGRRRDAPAADDNDEIQPDYGYDYENEDQSLISIRPGTRVRHPTFGVGTILTVEPLTDDMKLTVRFADIGRKTLRAKFAKLTLA